MPGDVVATRAKVQQYLTENFTDVRVDKDGDYSLRYGSTRIFVTTHARDHLDFTTVNLSVCLLFHVKQTPEVFEYIALHGEDYLFGHLNAWRTDDGLIISFSHVLLGDYLDEDELVRIVEAMLIVADSLDDELAKQFGGNRYYED